MTRSYSAQKAGLTRAINSRDHSKVFAEVQRTVREWETTRWPDDWARWQRALDDVTRGAWVDIEDLR